VPVSNVGSSYPISRLVETFWGAASGSVSLVITLSWGSLAVLTRPSGQ